MTMVLLPPCSLSKRSTSSQKKAQEEPSEKLKKGQKLIEKENVETGRVRRMEG